VIRFCLKLEKLRSIFTGLDFLNISDGKLYYRILTSHNFQNVDLTNTKKDKLIRIFEQGMKKLGIEYKNSFNFDH
jgi:hypothetical protein